MNVARSELIVGGQKSGKTRRAESLAAHWLAAHPSHRATYIATAQAWDAEMGERIARHQRERAQRVPGMDTVEEPLALAQAIATHSAPERLLVVDCLTLWLTNTLMPATAQDVEQNRALARVDIDVVATLLIAIERAPGPVVLVSNEIGLGVIPLGAEVRAFVDALGSLNQSVAGVCERVTLMAAGLPLVLKGGAA
ncbi:MAG: bifunctional adenosylcobinamide kinase/adenosylcobinamide-phosphate guanylyltransferase [Rhodoferax sp.]